MRASIHTYGLTVDDLTALAVAADQLGFDTLWMGEHVVLPVDVESAHPGHAAQAAKATRVVRADIELLDPWGAMGALSAHTSRINLATGMLIAPLRHPLATALSAATAERLTRGRFALGVGAGWLEEEFAALDVPFTGRGARLDETIAICRSVWRGGAHDHRGAQYAFSPLQIAAHPVRVPIVVGGNSGPALRRAASTGDAWFSSGAPSLAQARTMLLEAMRLREDLGNPNPLRCFVRVPVSANVREYEDAGFTDAVFHVDPDILAEEGGWTAWLDRVTKRLPPDSLQPMTGPDPARNWPQMSVSDCNEH